MRETQRRKLLSSARKKGEARIQAVAFRMLDRRYKSLKRELRRANLRKRLRKTGGEFQKNDNGWQEWIDEFERQVFEVLMSVIEDYGYADNQYWQANGEQPTQWDARAVARAYQERVGRLIRNIPEDTLASVQKEITDWYNSEAALPDLIASLEQYFSTARAEAIAATEMANIASEIAREQMLRFGITQWTWDAFNDAVTCEICMDLHGQHFSVDDLDSYPPAHPRCRCGCLYAGDDGKELYYQ